MQLQKQHWFQWINHFQNIINFSFNILPESFNNQTIPKNVCGVAY